MAGGLLQLITVGIQDSPLIANPEITYFKIVYKQYTPFSLCQNDRFIGNYIFNKEGSKILEKNGDLLYNLYFKLEIPYFDIIKTTINNTISEQKYNINQLDVNYINTNCIVLYNNSNWYVVPEYLFKLSSFENILTNIDANLLAPELLPEYIDVIDLSPDLFLYQIKDDKISSIISILRVNSNFWEQYWLDIISKSTDVDMLNKLLSLKTQYNRLYDLIKNRIYNLYWSKNYNKKNINYFNFVFDSSNKDNNGMTIYKSEVERYFDYINTDISFNDTSKYDMDIVYKYCIDNFLVFNDYRDNILPNNSILLLLLLNMLYSENTLIFTFWKKYETFENNKINTDIKVIDTNFNNEWNVNLNQYLLDSFNTTNIKNQIYEVFKKKFYAVEQKINNIFSSLTLLDPVTIYIQLKTILERYTKIPKYQINFNNYYLATIYDDNNIYNQLLADNYENSYKVQTDKYPTLNKFYDSLDTNEMNNLTPVDLQNIYSIIANDLLNLITSNIPLKRSMVSFIVLWRNIITNRLYRLFLDTYKLTLTNGNLTNFKNTRNLAFYYSIYPSNLFLFNDFKNSFYEMFYKNSWIGSIDVNNNYLLKLKENIYHININNLLTTDFSSNDYNFNKLNIINTYTYTYYVTNEKYDNYNKFNQPKIIYNNAESELLIKYDNIYNENSKIKLYVNDVEISYSNIKYETISISGIDNINFNSLYLAIYGINSISNGDIIKLVVDFTIHIPLVLFYKHSITYPKFNINKFYLLDKFTNNSYKINNITNNYVSIPNELANSSKIKILTISYLANNIVSPIINNNISYYELETGNINRYVNEGKHMYCFSFININNEESSISKIIEIDIPSSNFVKLINIPISDNNFVTGRKIYRTKANRTHFYLLATINNNTETTYIDDIDDNLLGVTYDYTGFIKYNELKLVDDTTIKTPINFELVDGLYVIKDYNNQIYELPTVFDNIKEIYVDLLDFDYELLDNGFNIENNGQIIIDNLSYDHLYYLLDPTNFKDKCKLVPNKNNVPFDRNILLEIYNNNPSSYVIPVGTYKYKISFYNTVTDIESLPNTFVEITVNTINNGIKISNFPYIYDKYTIQGNGYNSWKIYRTSTNTDTYYLLDTVIETNDNIYIDTKQNSMLTTLYTDPFLNITEPINTHLIIKPDKPILFNLNNIGNISKGIYKYVVTFLSNDEETLPSIESLIKLSINSQVRITIPISSNVKVIGRKIYRTLVNTDTYKLLAFVSNNTDTIYVDNISDTNLYNKPQPFTLSDITTIETNIINTFNLSIASTDGSSVLLGTFDYKIVFNYLIDDTPKQLISYSKQIITTQNSKINIFIPTSTDLRLLSKQIFRKSNSEEKYLLVDIISDNLITNYIDNNNILDPFNFLVENLIVPQLAITYNNELSNVNSFNITLNSSSGIMPANTYNYLLVYTYNTINGNQIIISTSKSITLSSSGKINITLPLSIDYRIIKRQIFRKLNSQSNYYLVYTFTNNINTSYIDNQPILLPITIPTTDLLYADYRYVVTDINEDNYETMSSDSVSINLFTPSEIRVTLSPVNNRIIGRKIYRTSYDGINYKLVKTVNNSTDTYVYDNIADDQLGALISTNLLNLVIPTVIPNQINYKILKIPIQSITPNFDPFTSFSTDYNFANAKEISDLNDYLFDKPFIQLVNTSLDSVSNLYSLINSFNDTYLYFYNIPFKINTNSVISLNDKNINYILPISTQQFYIKSNSDTYYKYLNNNSTGSKVIVNDYEILQNTFNPTFDEFNLSYNFIKQNYYSNYFVDFLIDKINNILSINADYKSIVDAIDNAALKYISIFTDLLNDKTLYGLTTTKILNSVDELNKITYKTLNNIYVDIINFKNNDYINYSHNSLRLIPDDNLKEDKELVTFDPSITSISILSPVYDYYNANNKISANLSEYLNNVRDYFNSHIGYVNSNIDYLNISNPNNYSEKYISYDEIDADINNNFYNYTGHSIINSLHPIIENDFYKINLEINNNNINLSNFTIDKTNNQIVTTDDIIIIPENNFYDTKILQTNRNLYNDNKFNYLGIVSLDSDHDFIFNDIYTNPSLTTTYFKLDNNNIYQANYKPSNGGRYYINNEIPDCLITNPIELTFNKINNNTINAVKLENKQYINIIKVTFENIFVNIFPTNLYVTKYLINNIIYDGYYVQLTSYTGNLYFITTDIINLTGNHLIYQKFNTNNETTNSASSWETSPKIINYEIEVLKEVNYTISGTLSSNNINQNGDIYYDGKNYNDCTNILEVNLELYLYIDSTELIIPIELYKKDSSTTNNVIYTNKPSFYISNNYIYYYYKDYEYTIELLKNNSNYYILLVDFYYNRYFMLQIKDIKLKEIPQGNYNCWIFPHEYLYKIPYTVNISIDSNGNVSNLISLSSYNIRSSDISYIPTFSFYLIEHNNNSCIYYYTNTTNITVNDNILYYNIRNVNNIDTMYLISNDTFNKEFNQLLKVYQSKNMQENYINKELIKNSDEDDFIFESIDDIVNISYTSEYIKERYTIFNYNLSKVSLLGNNEQMVTLILTDNNIPNMNIYQPIIIKRNETFNISLVKFTYNGFNYYKSFIPVNINDTNSNELLNSNSIYNIINNENILDTKYYIGTLVNLNGEIDNTITFYTLSPYISIEDNSRIYLNPGFKINNLLFDLHLWKLSVIDNNGFNYCIYFWTLFTNSLTLINSYLNVTTTPNDDDKWGIPAPYDLNIDGTLTIPNYGVNHTLIISSPNIISQVNNDYNLVLEYKDRSITYKYYTDTRFNDIENYVYNVTEIKYNSILNIKPSIELWTNSLTQLSELDQSLLSQIVILILVYNTNTDSNQKINIFLKSEVIDENYNTIVYKTGPGTFYDLITSDTIKNVSLYYSITYPTYINNSINIFPIDNDNYEITTYDILYLEPGEIIIINGNYFYINGLLNDSLHYSVKLIKHGNNILFTNNGYYSVGNYLKKDNKIMPIINYQNVMKFYKTYEVNIGDIYFSNSDNKLIVATSNNTIYNCNLFSDIRLDVYLFYDNSNLYLFDNLIKLKPLDKIIYGSVVYQIINIRDNQIYLDKIIVLNNLDKIFIKFILPYQPFEILYTFIDNDGTIVSNNINDNHSIVFNGSNNNEMIIYNVINNKISPDAINNIAGYYYIRLFKTDYYSQFENKMYIGISSINSNTNIYENITIDNYNFNNKHPIEIPTLYNHSLSLFKMLNESTILDSFNFYYMQPVFIAGTYNYISNIIYNDNYYYIKLLNTLNISANYDNTIINILCSSYYSNLYEYYTQLKINYNFALQSIEYNNFGSKILVVRYALKNDQLIFIENNKYYFDYGKSIADNELDNNISNEYKNIYFHNYCHINTNGTFDNFDTLHGSYHLIVEELYNMYEEQQSIQKIHLAKIIYPNKIKIYTDIDTSTNIFYLDRVIPIKINSFGEFIYTNPSIIQSKKLIEPIDNKIIFIKKYDIRFIGTPNIINNQYKQEIEFINKLSEPIDYILHTYVYTDEELNNKCNYIYDSEYNKYYLISDVYLTNDIKYLYTRIDNYILSTNKETAILKDIKINDITIKNDYIDYDYITEYYIQQINLSKVFKLDYKYDLIDNSTNFTLEFIDNYKIDRVTSSIFKINNNNRIISLYEPIDNDILEDTSETIKIDLYISNQISTNNIINTTRLFNNVKQLRVKLLDILQKSNFMVLPNYLFNYLKPWDNWSLLVAILRVPKLSELVNNVYLKYNGTNVIKMNDSLVNFTYLTNNELDKLSLFLQLVETNSIVKNNYFKLKEIETLIFNNLNKWLKNPYFLFDVNNNINSYLSFCGYPDAKFNGEYIVFDNDLNPLLYNNEPIGYISNEFIYNQNSKIVYRPSIYYTQINKQVYDWISHSKEQTNFGVNINHLLKYLNLLGNEIKELYYNFTNLDNNESYDYVYNNPLKFIINKLWYKYYNTNIYNNTNNLNDKAVNDIILVHNYTFTNEIYSGLQYDNNLNIKYSGLNTYNYYIPFKYDPSIELNISDLTVNEPNIIKIVNIENTLTTKPFYPCNIIFTNNEIIPNASYVIDYLNGVNIANDIKIEEPILYPDQLNFYSEYNIKPTDFLIVKQNKEYIINNLTLLGYKFRIIFDINIDYIDQLYFRNYYLTIEYKSTNYIDVLIPLTINELFNLFRLNNSDNFQIKNNIGIKKININNDKQYLDFYSNKFVFINNNTFIKVEENLYQLFFDASLNKYYINSNINLNGNWNILIITSVMSNNIQSLNNVLYQIDLNEPLVNANYIPVDNNYLIPLEFSLVSNDKTISISPIKINTIDNIKIILYFTINDSFLINNSKDIYYYFNNNNISLTNNTIVYLYDKSSNDIDIEKYIYEPTIDKTNKTATNIFILNNYIYITALINYENIVELNKNINYIILNKWTISTFEYVNGYLTFKKPSDMILQNSSNNFYYIINDTIPFNINVVENVNNNYVYISINTILTEPFVFKQYWINNAENSLTKIYNNSTINWEYINHNKKLGQNLINKINNIDKLDEYLYYFNLILNKTVSNDENQSTTIYLYNITNNDIDIDNGIFEPTIDTANKTSIYIQQNSSNTTFSIKNNYNLDQLHDYSFIQKNLWHITTYILEPNYITFKIPDDFIFINNPNYYYKINDIVVDTNNIIISNGTIKIDLDTSTIVDPVEFKQYYISSDNIINIPDKNRKVKITCDYSYQYESDDMFYIIPYSSSGKELKEYMYKIRINEPTTLNGFGGAINDSNDIIYLYSQFGVQYNGIIFDKYYENSNVYYIITLNEILDTNILYTYTINDNIVNQVLDISYYQPSLNFASYYYQDSSDYIYLFINDSFNEYLLANTDQIDKPTKFYLISYEDYQINNLYYDYTFKQNDNMKKIITYDTSKNIVTEKPIWNKATNLFNYVKLFLGDQLIEELNGDIMAFKYYLNLPEDRRQQIDEMIKIRFNGTKWELYVPLLFWFSNNPGLSIPIIAMPYTDIILKYKINDISSCLANNLSGNYTFSTTPNIRITLVNDFVLLDLNERKLFGSYSHEYIICRSKVYETNYINSPSNVIVKQLSGLVKDIYLVTKPLDSNVNYYKNITNEYDVRYNRYINAVNYYNLFSINNIYTSDEQRDYADDIQIIKNNLIEYNNYLKSNSQELFTRIIRLIDNFNNYKLWDSSNELLKMLMFMEDKYMVNLTDARKTYVLTMYLQYMYRNIQKVEEISPLNSLTIKTNGTELFSVRDWMYFNSVIPNQKYKNSLPMGYYVYSFSLHPNDDQYSGHLNFTNFDDIVFKITSEERVSVQPYNLHTYVKEYNILRIISGMASLAWID